MTSPITYSQYEKISDDLYTLGYNTILRFNVCLSKKGKDNNTRYSFHKEYKYNSDKYNDSLITIRRSFDYYLSIENIIMSEFGKEFIMIRLEDMFYIKQQIQEAMRWFTDANIKIYAIKDKKLIMLGKVEPIVISGLVMDKYISIEPIIYETEMIKATPGVRIYLSSDGNYVDMTTNKFMGFAYLIDSINLYESAQLLLNYIGRPEPGYNLKNFEEDNNMNEILNNDYEDGFMVVKKGNNRKINKGKSFFDRIEDM